METGTNEGKSTVEFCRMVLGVIGIDNNRTCLNETGRRLVESGRTNWLLLAGNSPDVLKEIEPSLPDETLYFLDAHWQSYWPILDEIRAIRRGSGVIVMHDFRVPLHPEWGCDSYNGHDLDYDYVKDALSEWSPSHRCEYNEEVEGSKRGVAFVFPS